MTEYALRGFSKYILMLSVMLLSVLSINAADDNKGLPFWEVGISDFHAAKPKALSIPGTAGALDYYWYWSFSFKPTTNIERARDYLEENLEAIEDEDEKSALTKQLARIKVAISRIDKLNMSISLRTDTGKIVSDISSAPIRNVIEKETHSRLYTIRELSEKKLSELAGTVQADGRVHAVAIFPELDPKSRKFFVQITGNGKRIRPSYEPDELLYVANKQRLSLKRVLRFSYSRVGNSGEAYLDKISDEGSEADWVWTWATQIFMQRPRKIVIPRASGVIRTYCYVPYKIMNNTTKDKKIEVVRSGIAPRISWRGRELRVPMLDDGKPQDRWKPMTMSAIRGRVKSGKEKAFVNEYEVISSPDAGEALRALINQDKAIKADILSKDGGRMFNGTIPASSMVNGIAVIRYGVTDIKKVVNELIMSIRAEVLSEPHDKEITASSKLVELYLGLRKNDIKLPLYRQAPEPTDSEVIAALLKAAKEDLGEEVKDEDKNRYGELAPIAALINKLADKQMLVRADGVDGKKGGFVDATFEVIVDGIKDSCMFPSMFKSMVPIPSKAVKPKVIDDPLDPDAKTDKPTTTEEPDPWD